MHRNSYPNLRKLFKAFQTYEPSLDCPEQLARWECDFLRHINDFLAPFHTRMTKESALRTTVDLMAEVDDALDRCKDDSSLLALIQEMSEGAFPSDFLLLCRNWLLRANLSLRRVEYEYVYPHMAQLLGAAFHQDWVCDHETWEAVIDEITHDERIFADESEINRNRILDGWIRLDAEVENILERFSDENGLETFFREIGSGIHPPGDGLGYGEWLREIRRRFQEASNTLRDQDAGSSASA